MVVLGVGSELRSDDGAGIRVAAMVEALHLGGVRTLDGGSAPENCTAEIRLLSPSHVIIVDAAGMGEQPGTVRLLDASAVGGAAFGTHGLPLGVLAAYLEREIGCRVLLVGIQPANVEHGETLSVEVTAAVAELAAALRSCLA